MPLTNKPTRYLYLTPEALERSSNETRHRYALADWIEQRPHRQPHINLRRTVIQYLRSTGDLAPTGRWSRGNKAKILLLFGSHAAKWLERAHTLNRKEAAHELRLMRDPEPEKNWLAPPPVERPLGPDEIDPYDLRPKFGVPGRVVRLHVEREVQRGHCSDFANWLDTRRKGTCNPQRAYRQWRGPGEQCPGTGRWLKGMPPHAWVKVEIEDRLGTAAAHFVLNTPSIDRQALAAKLRSL